MTTEEAEPGANGRADGKHWLDGFAGVKVAAPGATFGIIDPDYARIFTKARILAWSYGYACVAHGSFTRDLDLLLVPWTEQATAESAVRIIRMLVDSCDLRMDDKPADKPHERRAYSLHLKGFGEPRWVDLSVLPLAASQSTPPPESAGQGLSDAEIDAVIAETLVHRDSDMVFYRKFARDIERTILAANPTAKPDGESKAK